jgi:YD repeat-containing protein
MVVDSLSGLIQWTPGGTDAGVRPVTVKVVDGHGGQALQSFDLTVGPPPNHDPSITSTPAAAAAVGQPYRYAVAGSDADGDPLAFSLTQAPTGMAINPASGLIEWTPGAGQAGAHPVAVRLEDGHGGRATQDYVLTVTAASQATVPTLTGLTRAAAEAALRQARLAVGVLGFRHDAAAEGIVLVQGLAAGTQAGLGTAVDLTVSLGPDTGLPPDPGTVAPATDPTVATTVADSTQFLYSGPNPVQTLADGRPLAEGTIEALRAAVLRGRVLDRAGQPLPGVTVGIKDHPELGQTLSRADGAYDLAVNGGGTLTLDFQKAGHLPVQRQADVPWQDYVPLDDAVMIPLDGQSAAIQLGGASPAMQVAQGGPVTDADGARQATVLFPAGARATFTRPDGSTGALATLHVRATEYTVGDSGPRAMPGPLPANSGYTYAVELSVDEALAEGASRVDFDRPLPFYVDNFTGFAVGQAVPAGWYDRAKAAWVASDNGRVVKLLGVASGLADLDGDGLADDAAKLAALGVTAEERGQLALLYPVGKTLWRVPITHFTPWDLNWPQGTPQTLASPRPAYPPRLAAPRRDLKQDCANEASGSIIECENAVLGERLAIAGTPYTLNYRSDRAPGRTAGATLSIPLGGAGLLTGVLGIDLRIQIAGRTIEQSFPAATGQSQDFTWDGLDAYGRPAYGTQFATASVGYRYGGAYYPADGAPLAFGRPSASPALSPAARAPFTLWQTWRSPLEAYPASAARGLGGWTLDAQHHYDPVGQQLSFGGGGQRGMGDRRGAGDWAETAAGTGAAGSGGDGGPAGAAQLNNPSAVVVAPDGTAYVSETSGHRVRRVGPDGIVTTVAGSGSAGSTGDGKPATTARLNFPRQLALGPDGTLYIADSANHRIRRVGPDGTMTTAAGTGTAGSDGDGGPASAAQLNTPFGVAVGPDGGLYIGDTNNHRVRRVAPDGTLTTAMGTGTAGYGGDGGPAAAAGVNAPRGVAVGPDGDLRITDSNNFRLRRTRPRLPALGVTDQRIPSADGSELYEFSPAGRHQRTLDALTGAVRQRFVHDAAGRLAAVADGDGGTTAIERDALGNPTAVVAPDGQRTELAVDADGHLARVADPAGQAHAMAYTADGLLAEFRDPNGHASTFDYDGQGRLKADRDATGDPLTLVRSLLGDAGHEVALTTAEGRTTRHRVEPQANGDHRRTLVDAAGLAAVRIERPDGTATATGPDGTVLTTVEAGDPRFGWRAPFVRSATLATGGLTLTLTATRAAALADPADPLSLTSLTETATVNGRTSTRAYDAAARLLTATSAAGRTATANLDALGRPLAAAVAGLLPAQWTYDPRGRLTQASQGDRSTAYGYDAQGYLQSVTDPLGRQATYARDGAGRITQATLPGGRAVQYGYDAAGNLTSLTPPGQPAHLFRYAPTDRPAQYEPPAATPGGVTLHAYNRDKQPTRIARPDGQAIEFAYDAAGRLETLTTPEGATTHAYHAATGRLASVTAPDTGGLAFTYSGALLTGAQWSGTVQGAVGYAYDADFRVREVTLNGAGPVAFGYDADGLLTSAGGLGLARDAQNGFLTGTTLGVVGDGLVHNGFGEVAAYTATVGGGPVFAAAYGRDRLGRITQATETVQGVAAVRAYGYDAAGRLAEVRVNGAVTAAYGYDANGNRTTLNGQVVAHYDAQDRLLDYNGATYAHTANGELLSKTQSGQTTQYRYDVLGSLRQVTLPGGAAIDYVIDGANRRIGKKVNGALVQGFLYQDGLRVVAELDGANQVVSRFVYADKSNVPAYMVKGGDLSTGHKI